MHEHGIKFIKNSTPKRIEKLADGRLKVFYDSIELGEEVSEVFDTVMLATGNDLFHN